MSSVTQSKAALAGCSKLVGQSGAKYSGSGEEMNYLNYETGVLTYRAAGSAIE